jgi:hypothetical protein
LPELDQFKQVPDAVWQRVGERLGDVGVFADEERDFLPAPTALRFIAEVGEKLRSLGYKGLVAGALLEPPQDGATYLLYDGDQFDDPVAARRAWRDDYQKRWHDRVTWRVQDWITRLEKLRQRFETWIAGSQIPGLQIAERRPVPMHEDLMRRFKVPAREMPVYEIVQNGTRLMRVLPKGLWVVGGNGRVDLITKRESLVLVDASEPGSEESDWQIYRPQATPLNRQVFFSLLQQIAA